MYGLVNRAIEEMVRQHHGDAIWRQIADAAGGEELHFVSLESYPDEITYNLVAAASEVLDTTQENVLIGFGEYWVLYTGRSAFANLMVAAGNNMRQFLSNLDSLHMRLGFSMPHLTPPSFKCTEDTPNQLRVHYYSSRVGLSPMVVGLLIGLGKMFGESIDVEHDQSIPEPRDHEEFTIRFLNA